jgi:hypothetical protein
MFAINSELYPSPRNPCRHKSVWPRRRIKAEESSSLTRSAMAIEPHGIANCATASQPSQNDPQASLLGPCHRRLEMMIYDVRFQASEADSFIQYFVAHCAPLRDRPNEPRALHQDIPTFLVFSRKRRVLPCFPSDWATPSGALPLPVRHRLTRPPRGDYRSLA